MAKLRRKDGKGTVALVAAYLLVLQAMLAGLALGASAAPAAVDVFGNPLCVTSGQGSSQEDGGRHALPDCCVAGCAMFSTGLAPSPAIAAVPVELDARPPAVPVEAAAPPARPRGSPGNPRAPPSA